MNIQWNLCDMIPAQLMKKRERIKELEIKRNLTISEHHERMRLKREIEDAGRLKA